MSTLKIDFVKCHQDAQEYGSDDEHMISRLFFTVTAEGKAPVDATCDIKQAVGSNCETGSIEVGRISGYRGPVNYDEFRRAAEAYFRQLVGSQGRGIRIEGATNIRMKNNEFVVPLSVEVSTGDNKGGW